MIKKIFFTCVLCVFFIFFSLNALTYSNERFIDNNDGTLTDARNNLMWAAADNMGDITWQDAKIYCENPPIAGYKYSDWRMPTIKELKTLYDKGGVKYETDCGLNVRTHPGITLSCALVWSSEAEAISAYAFSFRKGYQYMTLKLSKKNFRALPVRSIKK